MSAIHWVGSWYLVAGCYSSCSCGAYCWCALPELLAARLESQKPDLSSGSLFLLVPGSDLVVEILTVDIKDFQVAVNDLFTNSAFFSTSERLWYSWYLIASWRQQKSHWIRLNDTMCVGKGWVSASELGFLFPSCVPGQDPRMPCSGVPERFLSRCSTMLWFFGGHNARPGSVHL